MVSGCLFSDGRHVLAGLKSKAPILSGLGGKAKKGETLLFTAWRETLEELFHFSEYVINDYIRQILDSMSYVQIIKNDSYISFVYSFIDLEKVLVILKHSHAVSPLYRRFPITIGELIMTRSLFRNVEITQLALMPFVPHLELDASFVGDITKYWNDSFSEGEELGEV